jgi:hypothetical protein
MEIKIMKTKICTDIEQSRKLAEILPLESSDGYWDFQIDGYKLIADELGYYKNDSEIPCWSLAALIEIIPWTQVNRMTNSCKWEASSWINSNFVSEYHVEGFDTPVDACYEMIIKLHEQKFL